MRINVLNAIYKTLLTTLPMISYNIFTNRLSLPFTIEPYSTYINFKMTSEQYKTINKYIEKYNSSLILQPIRIYPSEPLDYFISVNIYNCTSPFFMVKQPTARCEINTYVTDKSNHSGTLILDYCSNSLSLDPIDLFKFNSDIIFSKTENHIKMYIQNEKIKMDMKFDPTNLMFVKTNISELLIKYTDNIFYKNGICEKLYYDSSLTNSIIKLPIFKKNNVNFTYMNITFDEIHSMFYFKNKIFFICDLWYNLYNDIYSNE